MRRHLIAALVALAAAIAPASAQAAFSDYGLESVEASLSTTQAGAHPDLSFGFQLKSDPEKPVGGSGLRPPYAATKDVVVGLPPGLIGNPHAVAECSRAQFDATTAAIEAGFGEGCPQDSQIGIAKVQAAGVNFPYNEPIFNMAAPPGAPARLGLYVGPAPVIVDVGVRTDGDYGLNSVIAGISVFEEVIWAQTTIWGVPASPLHDTERFTAAEANQGATHSPTRESGLPAELPFLQNPTRCGVSQELFVAVDSYQEPGRFDRKAAALPPLSGCGSLGFAPEFTAVPTTREAASPSGLDVDLRVPQEEGAGRASAQLRDATVAFPAGMTLAAGAAEGLQACSSSQVGYKASPPPPSACPAASKLGSATFDVPQLPHPIEGALYQRTPGPPGELFRVWLVSDELGVHVKIPGEIRLDPSTGQVTSLFLDNPQVPLRELQLHIFGGPHGPFATPAACGTYQTRFAFAPWSGTAPVEGTTPMRIDQNCDTGGFAPTLSAGTADPTAGAFSSFLLRLDQGSGEGNLAGLQVTLPEGVLAKLAGVELCPDAGAAAGACPAGSQVGSARVASGVGPAPLWLPQPGREPISVYLAGPYKGAPYSLVVRAPAQAGPFDLGTVVVRAAIEVDPRSAQVTVRTDPLPQILEGVPVTYRTLYTAIDRPSFTLNPTSCEPSAVRATATSAAGAAAELSSPFQASSCASLGFRPKLSLRLKGPTGRTGNAALTAVLTPRAGEANLAATTVVLPPSQFIDQFHINNPCTRVQYAADACPKGSFVGTVKAWTPLLDEPLSGKVIFRSNGGERELPDVVLDLNGAFHIEQVGFVDSVRDRIRTRFASVPDAPISKAVIRFFGGRRGLLENSEPLCARRQLARVVLAGHNGRRTKANQAIAVSCGKKGRKGHRRQREGSGR